MEIRMKELVERLAKSDIVRREMPMQLQLGLPLLERSGDNLLISFCPHREMPRGDVIDVFPQAVKLAWVYPFTHLAYFHDLLIDTPKVQTEALAQVQMSLYLNQGRHAIETLYASGDHVFDMMERNGSVTDTTLKRYRETYEETARVLGLEELYL